MRAVVNNKKTQRNTNIVVVVAVAVVVVVFLLISLKPTRYYTKHIIEEVKTEWRNDGTVE